MKQVRVEIKSLQNGKEISYIYTHGTLRFTKEGEIRLDISDAELVGHEKGRFSLSVCQDGRVTLSTKKGREATSFVFEKGVQNHCHFQLGQELSVIGVKANDVAANIGRDGGRISLKYTIDFVRMPSVLNEMQIRVFREKEDPSGLDRYFSRYGKLKS